MPAHERLGDADGLGFRCGHSAPIVQVPRFGTVAAVPHLLRDGLISRSPSLQFDLQLWSKFFGGKAMRTGYGILLRIVGGIRNPKG